MLATTFKNCLSVSEEFTEINEVIESFKSSVMYVHRTEMPKIGKVTFVVMHDMSVFGITESGKSGVFEPDDKGYDETLAVITIEAMERASNV